MAQFGRALRSGRRGRRFKSCHLDQKECPLWIPSAEMPMVSGFSGIFGPQISQEKQKIQTGVSQKMAGFKPQNFLEIHSALFEMRFFKKGAVFISSKNQSAKGVNLSANRLKDWRLFSYSEKGAKVTEEGESLLCRGQTPVAAGGDSPPDQQAWRSKSAGTNEPIQSK